MARSSKGTGIDDSKKMPILHQRCVRKESKYLHSIQNQFYFLVPNENQAYIR